MWDWLNGRLWYSSFFSLFFFVEKRRGEEGVKWIIPVNCIFANFSLYSYFHLHLNVKLRQGKKMKRLIVSVRLIVESKMNVLFSLKNIWRCEISTYEFYFWDTMFLFFSFSFHLNLHLNCSINSDFFPSFFILEMLK